MSSRRLQIDDLIRKGKTAEAAAALNDWGASESDVNKARALLLEALQIGGDRFETLANLALIDNEDQAVNAPKKLESLNRALVSNPRWFQGKKLQASLLDDLGQEDKAIRAYRTALELNPSDVDCIYDLGLVLSKAGSLDEAVALARRAVELNSQHCPANVLLAELLWRSGAQPREVVQYAKKALEIKPIVNTAIDVALIRKAKYSACLVLAAVLEQSEKPADAVQFLTNAVNLAIEGSSAGLDVRPALIRLAALHSRLGDDEQARVCYKKLQSLIKDDDVAGKRVLSGFLGCQDDGYDSPKVLSSMCEAFISNSRLDSASDLVHKARLFLNLQVKDVMNVCPQSALVKSTEQCIQVVAKWKTEGTASPLYFLKDPSIQRGQGIHIVAEEEFDRVPKTVFSDNRAMLLQVGVHPPYLVEGKKFGLRVHALVLAFPSQRELSVFVFEDCILTKCWLPYAINTGDPLVHISSTSVQRNVQGFDRDVSKGLASRMFPQLPQVLESIRMKIFLACKACHQSGKGLHNMRGGKRPLLGMQLFGFDVMLRDDLEPFIAEANASPQFQDAKKTKELLEGFALPMMNGVADIVAAGFDKRSEFTCSAKDSKVFNRWVFAGDI